MEADKSPSADRKAAVSFCNFSENARSAERNFLLKSSRALARWVLLTPDS